jgi:erythromycin esterase-like protein
MFPRVVQCESILQSLCVPTNKGTAGPRHAEKCENDRARTTVLTWQASNLTIWRSMATRAAVWFAVALMLAAGVAAQDQAVVNWLRANAIPLTTVEAGHGFDDMQPLKKLVGDTRVVALGEATHGSREIFQLKHRMVEFLATEMGFTIFSMEANMPEADRLNDYVLNGTGDPALLLRGLYFWTWDTEEVLAMIQWMRDFNRSGKGRIEFTGFDMQTPTVAVDNVRTFCTRYDPDFVGSIRTPTQNAFGVATGTFPIAVAAGKKIRYSGFIKTEGLTRGWAGLWWRVDGASGALAFDNMQGRGATGTSDWKQYAIELPVDASAKNINFGLILAGDGQAWFDDLTVELDGQPYTDDSLFDFGFESPAPKGFRTGGQSYRVGLDAQAAHTGKQSLRMQYEATPVNTSEWQDIVAHLEKGRVAYRDRGVSDREIEWTIQNARVVLQSIQAQSVPVSRERSMAENIKWIADHNPGAKMVLWAHNGHVATGAGFGDEAMGVNLRSMFGKSMVVIGTAFNEGSFQAMPMPGQPGGLKNFTVPPALADSLDATFSATKLPLFAIDLREAPAWFKDPHRSREIGCCYPENQPYALLGPIRAANAFDAMVFIEKVTAAHKNPGR